MSIRRILRRRAFVVCAKAQGAALTGAQGRFGIAQLLADLKRARAEIAARDANFASANATADSLQKKLEEQTAINQKLCAELTKLGKDVDQLLAEEWSSRRLPRLR